MGNCIGSRGRGDGVEKVDGGSGEKGDCIGVTPASEGIKVFKFADLKMATRNFRPDMVLGEGFSSVVSEGWVDGETLAPCKKGCGIPIAVKRIIDLDSSRVPEEWQAEVKFLGERSHPNLVKLYGYCWEENQLFLVYECMQGGTLDNCLFRRGSEPLSWEIRMKIAIDAARALAFLHSLEGGAAADHDFKTSSILLDKNFNAKLLGSGLAEFKSTTVTSPMSPPLWSLNCTYGYAAPEYVAAGYLSDKSNVYGFGVVLAELLTGVRAVDRNRPAGQKMLVEWVKLHFSKRRNLKKIIDSRLGDQYPLNAAVKVSRLVLQCLGNDPKTRPSMEEVLQALLKIRGISQTAGET